MPVCTRCGHRNAEDSRFCSNCGAPLRAGVPERPSETTSTISISGLEAYEAEVTGQTASPSLSPRPRRRSTPCPSARRSWWSAVVRIRAAAFCWTAI